MMLFETESGKWKLSFCKWTNWTCPSMVFNDTLVLLKPVCKCFGSDSKYFCRINIRIKI